MSSDPATASPITAAAPVDLSTIESTPDTTFELGLVMAGAISAGAYTAGVIDFLFKALNCWYDPQLLQEADLGWHQDTPPHDIQLKTMAGASAGGMCAALTAISILDGDTSRFQNAWVNTIDIKDLLDDADLAQRTAADELEIDSLDKLKNVLNCAVLDRIANAAITLPQTTPAWPAWLGNELNFYLTLTNLNGLVYEVPQQGGTPQRFIDHADRIQYKLLSPGSPVPTPPLNPALRVLRAALPAQLSTQDRANWEELKTAALATGAFPVALLNRQLFFDNPYYNQRHFWYGSQPWLTNIQRAGQPDPNQQPYPAPYLFVDGGVTNNEPYELVRRTLVEDASGETASNPHGATSRRAAVLIDPFPSETNGADYKVLKQELKAVIPSIYTALRNQSRYRSEDLIGALDLDEHSRFLIAPVRETDMGQETDPAAPPESQPNLACGTLGAFGGFLHQNFREHDFELGRRNCQRFLQQWFSLPATNALFQKWPAAMRQKFVFIRPNDPLQQERLPIIPLLGDATTEQPAPSWHQAALPVTKLQNTIAPLLEKRLDRLTTLLKAHIPGKWWWLYIGYSWFIRPKLRRAIQKKIMTVIGKDLNEAGLLTPKLTKQQIDDL